MADLLLYESSYRLAFSLGGLALFLVLGLALPFRTGKALRDRGRWFNNIALSFGNALLLRVFLPVGLVGISQFEPLKALELWSAGNEAFWLQILFGLLILDLVVYWQHRLTHTLPLLWRLHRVHHSDPEVDTTTAGRFHPIEIFLSFLLKALVIVAFDVNPYAIVAFEIVLNFSSLFNHTNIEFPRWLEGPLRLVLITPGLHRIHHSVEGSEMNSNFGFSVSWWDRIFGSYLAKSQHNTKTMSLGLNQFREASEQNLWALIKQPLSEEVKKSRNHKA